MTADRMDGAPPVAGRVHSVESLGASDGPGLRYVVFFQGCPLRCLYCHNPDSRPFDAGTLSNSRSVMAKILPLKNFLRTGGVTLSGGEPLAQPDFALDLLHRCRAAGFHTALDTSGCFSPESPAVAAVLDAADLILLDIKSADPDQCLRLTGRTNADAFAVLDRCERTGKPVWVRHVLVPGWTLSDVRLDALAARLRPYRCVEKVELLPFHKMGEEKWRALGWPYELYDTPAVDPATAENAEKRFRRSLL